MPTLNWIGKEAVVKHHKVDSFAGSGTTGHVVLKQNAEDGGITFKQTPYALEI